MATVLARDQETKEATAVVVSDSSSDNIPALGAPLDEKRFWFQRTGAYDADTIATQV